jgi:Ni/Co efflux regulator RcnB
MRKLLISLLLAGAAATPAIAGPHDWADRQSNDSHQQASDNRQQAHEERAQAREERQQSRADSRAERSAGRPPMGGPAAVAQQVEVRQQALSGGNGERFNGRGERGNFAGNANSGAYVAPGPRAVGPDMAGRDRFDQVRDPRGQYRGVRESDRQNPNFVRDRRPLEVSNVPRPGTQPPLRVDNYRRGETVHWNRDWRNNDRYDWRRYRDHHRSRFHLGFYVDPFGWGYQSFDIGYRMWPAYYGNQYWIDPAMYDLPYPPPGAAWVRYWNDAVLVDIYTGTVLDVIPGFFW